MSRRPEIYKQALDMQSAVNTRALLTTLVKLWPLIVEDMEARGEVASTDAVNSHPVVRLWLSKLVDLSGMSVDRLDASLAESICVDRASSTGVCPKGYSPWVKRLGQFHLSKDGCSHDDPLWSTTLCGMPMLGNNHARALPESEWKPCPECAAALEKIESTTKVGAGS